jgi:phage-related protein (TIGR01555 family)
MIFLDNLKNLLTRLGTSSDKTTHAIYGFTPMQKDQLDNAYRADWIIRKVIDIPANDATREWRSWQDLDGDDIQEVEDLEKELKIQAKVREAMIKARLYGGAGLVLGVDGTGASNTPLDLDRVTKDSLKFVHVVSRYDLAVGPIILDVMSPDYGVPEYYERSIPTMVRIHPSRVVRFTGAEVPDRRLSNDGWGDSVVQMLDDACKAAGLVSASGATLVQELCYDIIKIPGFMSQVATKEYEDRVTARFAYTAAAKGVTRAILLDKDEEWERITTNIASLPEIVKVYLLIASGAADIPVTRMLGQSPTGLSATGESDTRNYYDRVKSDQKVTQEPAMNTLDEVLIRSAVGSKPDGNWYVWNPLWQLNDVERATRDKAKADTFKIDVDTGLINEDALRQARINQLEEDGTYPGLEEAIEKFGDKPDEPDGMFDPQTGLPTDPVMQAAHKVASGLPPPANANNPKAKAAANENALFGRAKKAADALLVADARRRFADRDHRGRRKNARQFSRDATPRTLYMRRDVLNGSAILRHFREQGVDGLFDAKELHVTIAYSKTPIDWMKIGGESWGQNEDGTLSIPPGGIRLMEALGDTTSLLFTNSNLSWRHESICYQGASWDYESYQPHIAIGTRMDKDALSKVEPWQGAIELGPEIAEEINPSFNYAEAAE